MLDGQSQRSQHQSKWNAPISLPRPLPCPLQYELLKWVQFFLDMPAPVTSLVLQNVRSQDKGPSLRTAQLAKSIFAVRQPIPLAPPSQDQDHIPPNQRRGSFFVYFLKHQLAVSCIDVSQNPKGITQMYVDTKNVRLRSNSGLQFGNDNILR